MSETIGDRIKIIREELNLSMAAFGDKIKMTNSNISKMEKGLRTVTDRSVTLICNEFNINENWLRTGEGEMFVQSTTFSLDDEAKKHNLTELEIGIMHGYMMLDKDTREKVVNMLEEAVLKKHAVKEVKENNIDKEVEAYRQELLAEEKGVTSSVLDESKKKPC